MRLTFIIPFLSLLFFSDSLFAQSATKFSGTVIDSVSRQPLEFVQAGLFNKEGKVIEVAATNEAGVFTFNSPVSGAEFIRLSFVGYHNKKVYFKEASGNIIKVKSILLAAMVNDLQEVKVSGSRKTVIQKPGMLIYNAGDDPDNKGGTAADVLRKAPVLSVDPQGNVSMRGNRNIKILIDGKYSGQMAKNAADALNMIPSDIIASVEIITTPSAKYDAEGAAGVINIVTKKDHNQMSGSLEAAVSNREQVFNPRISGSGKKWSLNANAHLHRLRSKNINEYTRESFDPSGTPLSILQQFKLQENVAPHGSASFAVDFRPDSINQLSVGFTSWFGNWPENNSLTSQVRSADGIVLENYSQQVNTKANNLGGDINFGYVRKLKKFEREFNLLAQFSPSRNHSDYLSEQMTPQNVLLYKEINESLTNNREWTLQADYLHPFDAKKTYIFEGGLKMIDRNVSSDYEVQGSSSGNPAIILPIAGRTDIFTYGQQVYSAYGIFKLNLPKDWFAEIGTRYEHTHLNGSLTAPGSRFEKEFNNLIPTATISKKLNDNESVSASYTKRLTRPYIWDLNPNPDASDPKNIVSGNPNLDPEIANQAEISYALTTRSGASVTSALFWREIDNAIEEYSITDENGISTTTKQNLAASRQLGLNISAGIPLIKNLKLNSNLNLYRLNFSSDALNIAQEGWNADMSMSISCKLSKGLSFMAFGDYVTRTTTLQGYKTPRSFYSLTAKKEITAKKMAFILALYNPFNKTINQSEFVNTSSFRSNNLNQQFYQTVKFTVSWSFGKTFDQKKGKKVNNDDVKGRSVE